MIRMIVRLPRHRRYSRSCGRRSPGLSTDRRPLSSVSRVVSIWYATRSSNNTTIYMDLGESSASFRIRCLEFYFPRHSVAFPSLFLCLPLSHCRSSSRWPTLFSFSFTPLGSPSLAFIPRIAPPGISEVLSRIQGLASSLMDGSAILFRPTPLRALTTHRLKSRAGHPFASAYSSTRCQITSRLDSRIHARGVRVRLIARA